MELEDIEDELFIVVSAVQGTTRPAGLRSIKNFHLGFNGFS